MLMLPSFRHLLFIALVLASCLHHYYLTVAQECSDSDPTCTAPEEEEEDYSDWVLNDFWAHFECDDVFKSQRPIHDLDTWIYLRKSYVQIVGESHATLTPHDSNGFHVEIVVKQNEKGRGVYANQHIAKSTLIWNTRQTARFTTGDEYRRYLMSIGPDLACDAMQWAYVQEISDSDNDGEPSYRRVSMDIDEGSLINSAWNEADEPNIGCDSDQAEKLSGGCQHNYFALSDIEPGEELLLDYGDFAISDGWEEFGLENKNAKW